MAQVALWHWSPTQAAESAWGSAGQAAQAPLQRRYPAAQASWHTSELQVVVPWGSVGHAKQLVPQAAMLKFATQAPLQRCAPLGQLSATHWFPAQAGVPTAGQCAQAPSHSR